MKRSKYEIFCGKDHNWYWRLRAANGEILCISEGYVSPGNAVRGAKAARRASFLAKVFFEKVKL